MSTPCTSYDTPISLRGAVLSHIDFLLLRDFVIWADGSVHFPLRRSGSGVIGNCSLFGA